VLRLVAFPASSFAPFGALFLGCYAQTLSMLLALLALLAAAADIFRGNGR
jgi:hypothetical protein